MRKGKVLSMSDESYGKDKEWVELHSDPDGVDVFEDYDDIWEVYSRIPREMSGTKGAEDPFEEIEDEDGYGTGKYRIREELIAFPVSAYIHSGIALSLGQITEFPCDPGGWDTTPSALILYTEKEKYERVCGKGSWFKVKTYDEHHNLVEEHMAKDRKEFRDFLEDQAEAYVKMLNLALEGSVYGYTTHKSVKVRKTYEDGRVVDMYETEDGDDSCWGFLTDNVEDIDFPKDLPVYADNSRGECNCKWLEGKEYTIPEFVIVDPERKGCTDEFDSPARYLKDYRYDKDGKVVEQFWTHNPEEAYVLVSWWTAQSVAQDVIPKSEYKAERNIQELDKAKKEYNSAIPGKGQRETGVYAMPKDLVAEQVLSVAEGVSSVSSGGCSVGGEGLAKGFDTHGTVADTPSWMTSGRHG